MCNEKQLGLAFAGYAGDFDNYIPCIRWDAIGSIPWWMIIGERNDPNPSIGMAYLAKNLNRDPSTGAGDFFCSAMDGLKGCTWSLTMPQSNTQLFRKLDERSFTAVSKS